MNDETKPYTIPVTVEWALWGKERRDLEYRLLRCSDGVLSSANFDELLTRYATGTLEALPQVTISWFEDRGHGHYIALSIHEEPEDHRVDATGRPVVLTRCFCVPYATLAESHVSYTAMYDEFRKIPLHEREGTFETALPVMQPDSHADLSAQRAAALLMTCKPVCILGADRISLGERLEFIDFVMSLLPYGLRCQLSASTWASSQFWEHKFRLFFSSARRPDDELDVIWGGDARPVTYPGTAEYYWDWLRDDTSDLVSQPAKLAALLAGKAAPVRFRSAEVDQLADQLYDPANRPRRRPRPPQPPPRPSIEERRERTVEELLVDCADRMRGRDQFLVRTAIRRLAERSDEKTTAEQRQRYQLIITERQLLREETWLDGSVRATLYTALLDIAFEVPLDYESYCQLESCVGIAPGQPIQRSLLRAIDKAGKSDIRAMLLMLNAGGSGLRSMSDEQIPLSTLIGVVSDVELRREHGRAIYNMIVYKLTKQAESQILDEQLLRSTLAEQGYLAQVLRRIFSEPENRLSELRWLVRLAYGGELDRSAIHVILGTANHMPTIDLFFAVVAEAGPKNAEFAERTFTRKNAHRYSADTRNDFLRRLPPPGQRPYEDEDLSADPVGAGGRLGLRRRTVARGQVKQRSRAWRQRSGAHVASPGQGTGRAAVGSHGSLAADLIKQIAVIAGVFVLLLIMVAILAVFRVI